VYLFAVVFQFHIEVLKKQRELRGIQVSAMGSLFHFRSNAPSLLPLSDPAGPGRWERAVRSLPLDPHLDLPMILSCHSEHIHLPMILSYYDEHMASASDFCHVKLILQ